MKLNVVMLPKPEVRNPYRTMNVWTGGIQNEMKLMNQIAYESSIVKF